MTFSLIFFFLVAKLALMMRELTGLHPMSARCAVVPVSMPHLPCVGLPPLCAPNTAVSLRMPPRFTQSQEGDEVSRLFRFLAVLPASYIVLMFQVAILIGFLGVRRGVSFTAPFRLPLHCVIILPSGGPSSLRSC